MKTEDILSERKNTHGDFKTASETHYKVKALFRPPMEKNGVPMYRIEAVEAIVAKLNRIVHGNHNHEDHWDDIKGYAELGKGQKKEEPYCWPCRDCGEHKIISELEVIAPEIWFAMCKDCALKRGTSSKMEHVGANELQLCDCGNKNCRSCAQK